MSLEQNVITTKGMMKDVATTSVTLTGAWWVEGGGGKNRMSASWPLWGMEGISQYTLVKKNHSLFDFSF